MKRPAYSKDGMCQSSLNVFVAVFTAAPVPLNKPFSHAYLTTLGETLLPSLPVSLTAPVILPYSLNAVTPNIGTGFDLGVEIHGLVADKFGSSQ